MDVMSGKTLADKFTLMRDRSADLYEGLMLVREAFYEMERRHFETNGSWPPGSDAWAPLKPSTIQKKVREQGTDLGILRRTDAGYKSLTGQGGGFTDVGPNYLYVGSRVQDDLGRTYLGWHMTGFSDRGGMPVPARKPIQITEAATVMFAGILQDWLTGGAGAVRLGGHL